MILLSLLCLECIQSITSNQSVQYVDLKYNLKFEKWIHYSDRLILKVKCLWRQKSLVGHVVSEMSQTSPFLSIQDLVVSLGFNQLSLERVWLIHP